METARADAIVLTWDPAVRLATIRFETETRATEAHAKALVAAMTSWVGPQPAPFGLLGDGRGLKSLDAGYRATWGDFLKRHAKEASVAFFHMGPVIRVAADMFRLGTGLKLKAFAAEDDARAWLRKAGIQA